MEVYMKINVCNLDLGEIRRFEHVDFNKSVRKAKYLTEKMSEFGNRFIYEIDFEESPCEKIITFENFNSFKTALKEVCELPTP